MGFVNDQGLSIERNIIDPHIHSEKLLTLLGEVLRQAKVDLGNLDAIAISIGPGSFTGLRIGLSTAKGLCYSLNNKLIAVSTFDAVARAAQESKSAPSRINIVIDAKQGEFYFGTTDLKMVHAMSTMNVQTQHLEGISWSEYSSDATVWITDRPDVIRGYGIPSELIFEYSSFCRGDAVARLATGKYTRNEFADIASLEPKYLKEFLVKTAIT